MNQRRGSVGSRAAGVCVAAAVAALLWTADTTADDWPQFRGVERNGISSETGLVDGWDAAGPKELWRVPLGEGYSGIAVVDGRIYTMYADDHEGEPTEYAAAFDAASGKRIWRTPLGKRHDTQFGNGPRSTPTVDGDTVYVLDSTGSFAALASADGTERWRHDVTEAFGGKVPYWGYSTSALVDGKLVVLEVGGGEGKSWVALDKKTGESVWSIGDSPAGYNSLLPVEIAGQRQYVYVQGQKLAAMTPEGDELWSFPWPQGETHAMPLFIPPNRVFASGVQDVGATLIEIDRNGDAATADEVWKQRFMRNHFSSSVVHDGHIYGFDNATLKCISIADGELAWAKRGLGKGSLILVEGKLIVLSDRGELLLVRATPEAYSELGRHQALEGRCWTAPSLAGGRLYLRNHVELVSFDLAG